ncbi:hypothetical protein BHM03_00024022 [Ensete ventricosum]|nr:hypothetical protein BHM03_00024022 [Ensete ventricosum]
MGGTTAGANGVTTESTPKNRVRVVQPPSYTKTLAAMVNHRPRRYNHRLLPEFLGGSDTIVAHRWYNLQDFRKSDSLHFSNPELYLMLTNSHIN